ncbi:MAG: hypothetical protein AB7O24_04235 [Kofleriaceae bacterium]
MAVRLTTGTRWQLVGHRVGSESETPDAEPFTGIGFYARPRTTSKAEAVLASVGEASHAVAIATRDEDLRRIWKSVLDAAANVTAIFNSLAIVVAKPDGTVEVRSLNGTARSLALKSDVQNVDSKYDGHVHGASGASTTGPLTKFIPGFPPVTVPLVPATIQGTDVLKGE